MKGYGSMGSCDYREYALLGRGKNLMIRQDFAEKYIEKQVEDLFKSEKLVLVLDLDNTLIHTKEIGQDRRIRETKVTL